MGHRIVIVDDAAFIREVLVQLLSKSGYEIVGEAADGDEAVRIIQEKQPDLVLMDIVMPRKSGIQATLEIKKLLPQIKVVACSTEGSENMVLKALEAGCCDYVVKPFQSQQLLRVIETALNGKSQS